MNSDLVGVRQLVDAALVRAARQRTAAAVTKPTARPFDPAAAARMRRELGANLLAGLALHRRHDCAGARPRRIGRYPSRLADVARPAGGAAERTVGRSA